MTQPTQPLDLAEITRELDRALRVWQEIQSTTRPSLVTDWTICVEQSAADVPGLVRTARALIAEVERVRLAADIAISDALKILAERDQARAEVARLTRLLGADAIERDADAFIRQVADETGESVETVRQLADAMACCDDEERVEAEAEDDQASEDADAREAQRTGGTFVGKYLGTEDDI